MQVRYTKVLVGGVLDGMEVPTCVSIPPQWESVEHWVEFLNAHNSAEKLIKPCVGSQKYYVKDYYIE